jgi:hypothetical protein
MAQPIRHGADKLLAVLPVPAGAAVQEASHSTHRRGSVTVGWQAILAYALAARRGKASAARSRSPEAMRTRCPEPTTAYT